MADRLMVMASRSARLTGQTAAVASVLAYTPAADASFLVCIGFNFTTATSFTISATVSYTDETNTARTQTLSFSLIGGGVRSSTTNVDGAGPRNGVPLLIRAKGGTAITIATTGTFTTVTYNVEAMITQTA